FVLRQSWLRANARRSRKDAQPVVCTGRCVIFASAPQWPLQFTNTLCPTRRACSRTAKIVLHPRFRMKAPLSFRIRGFCSIAALVAATAFAQTAAPPPPKLEPLPEVPPPPGITGDAEL